MKSICTWRQLGTLSQLSLSLRILSNMPQFEKFIVIWLAVWRAGMHFLVVRYIQTFGHLWLVGFLSQRCSSLMYLVLLRPSCVSVVCGWLLGLRWIDGASDLHCATKVIRLWRRRSIMHLAPPLCIDRVWSNLRTWSKLLRAVLV